MAKFLNANLGELPLPEVQTRAFRRAHAPSFDRGAGRAVAMGWEISTRGPTELHAKNGAGAGFSSWVGIEPQGRRGVAVLTNVQHRGEASPAALGRALLDAMRAASPKP
jgi:CubicO group peptidase (beta-lactamase class C family)